MNLPCPEADVIVVGGGSAGATAAIRAQEMLPRGRVVLLEKAHIKRTAAGEHLRRLLVDPDVEVRKAASRVLHALEANSL